MGQQAGTPRRRGRPAGRTPRLSRDGIVEEARRIVSAEGFDGLSVRKLAAALGVDPMAIYHHLPNKEAVIRAVIQQAFGAMPLPDPAAPWRDRVRSWARSYCELAGRHPGLVLRTPQNATAVAAAMTAVSTPLVKAFVDGGLAPKFAVTASGVLVDFLNGFLLAGEPSPEGAFPPGLEAHLEAGLRIICAGAVAPTDAP